MSGELPAHIGILLPQPSIDNTLTRSVFCLAEFRIAKERQLHDIAVTAVILIPVFIFIAIVRFDLLDIDRLISSTAAYSVLFILVLTGALLVTPQFSQATSRVVGLDPRSGHIALSFLLVALVVPGQRYLRPQIERLFFPERYALEQGKEQLCKELSICQDSQDLLSRVGERLHTLVQPENCVLYRRESDIYTPVFVQGSVIPQAFETHGALSEALQSRAAHPTDEQWWHVAQGRLEAADRTMLDSLRMTVVLAIGQETAPTAFLCLGKKSSGDIYTPTDLVLLKDVATSIGEELHRLEGARPLSSQRG